MTTTHLVISFIHTSPFTHQDTQDLEKRVAALEVGATFDATQAAVQQVQMDCLQQLRDIRTSLEQQGAGGASSKELTALYTENILLKAKMAKQEYRIQHLCEVVEELLAQRDQK